MGKKIKSLWKKQGFTLVELIIVIAIIAVLAVAAFMLLTKWLANSRDSRRLGDVSTIKKALSITFVEKPYYPEPDNKTAILDEDGVTMWYQGVFGSGTIQNMDNLQKAPIDPSDGSYFRYAVTMDQKEYQIGATLEKGEEATLIQSVLASTLIASIDGNYDGYATYTTGGNTYIIASSSLLLYTGNSLDTSGDNTNLMINGEEIGTEYEIKSVNFAGTPDNDTLVALVRDTFGLTGDNADNVAMNIIKSNSNITPSAISYATCSWDGGSITHGTVVTAYSTTSVAYNETCSSVSETRTCNNGTLSGAYTNASCSSEGALDCNEETKIIGGHTYEVGGITHGNSESVNSQTGTINHGIQYWTTEFTCTNGVLSNETEAGPTTNCETNYVEDNDTCVVDQCGSTVIANAVSNATSQSYGTDWNYNTTAGVCTYVCDTNYSWDNIDSCIADTQLTNCGGSIVTNATASTDITYTQTWDGDSWAPTTNWGESQATCDFNCDLNYTWDGDSCEADTQGVACGGSIVANATASTATTYTQTWDGTDWAPTTNWGESQATCDFNCDLNYTWDGTSCEADTQEVTCGGSIVTNATASTVTTYTQTWNGTDWTPNTSWGIEQVSCDFNCNTDFHWESSQCLADTKSCTIVNGLGSQTWNGSSRPTCSPVYCYAGFTTGATSCTWSGYYSISADDTDLATKALEFNHVKSVNGSNVFYIDSPSIRYKTSGLIPIDTTKTYRLSGSFRSNGTNNSYIYFGLIPYDENGNLISPLSVSRYGNEAIINSYTSSQIVTDRTLTNWNSGAVAAYVRNLAFYYDGDTTHLPDATLYYAPGGAYSTGTVDGAYSTVSGTTVNLNISIPSNISSNIIPGTTKVMNHGSGGTYIYTYAASVPDTWQNVSWDLTDEQWGLGNAFFRKGTKYVKIMVMGNRGQSGTTGLDLIFNNIVLDETP